MNVTFCT
jgi:hypothetical protein